MNQKVIAGTAFAILVALSGAAYFFSMHSFLA